MQIGCGSCAVPTLDNVARSSVIMLNLTSSLGGKSQLQPHVPRPNNFPVRSLLSSDYAIATWGRWHGRSTLPEGVVTTAGAVRSWHALVRNGTIASNQTPVSLTSLSIRVWGKPISPWMQ